MNLQIILSLWFFREVIRYKNLQLIGLTIFVGIIIMSAEEPGNEVNIFCKDFIACFIHVNTTDITILQHVIFKKMVK